MAKKNLKITIKVLTYWLDFVKNKAYVILQIGKQFRFFEKDI